MAPKMCQALSLSVFPIVTLTGPITVSNYGKKARAQRIHTHTEPDLSSRASMDDPRARLSVSAQDGS